MEYRRRRRRPYGARRQRGTLLGAVLCVLLVSAAVVYLVGLSDAGSWIAAHVVAPVFRTLGVGGGGDGGASRRPQRERRTRF